MSIQMIKKKYIGKKIMNYIKNILTNCDYNRNLENCWPSARKNQISEIDLEKIQEIMNHIKNILTNSDYIRNTKNWFRKNPCQNFHSFD